MARIGNPLPVRGSRTQGSVYDQRREGCCRPARHRVERSRGQLRALGATHPRRGGVRCRPRCAHGDVLDRASSSTSPRSASPKADHRRSSSPPRPPSTACGSAARVRRSPPMLREATGGRSTASSSPARRHDPSVSQDPLVHLWRRGQALPSRRRADLVDHRRGPRRHRWSCYDLRFADEFWQRAAATDVFVVTANWPAPRRLHWQTLLQARAIENLAYVVGCNRVGTGGGLDYTGDSRIVDPLGELLATAAGDETTLFGDGRPRPGRRRAGPFRIPRRPPLIAAELARMAPPKLPAVKPGAYRSCRRSIRHDGLSPLRAQRSATARRCHWGCGTTSVTTAPMTRSGRSCGGRSTGASPTSTWPTTTARRTGRRRSTSAGCSPTT